MTKSTKPTREKIFDHWSSDQIIGACPLCHAHAIVELTERLKQIQPDGTTHVCHLGFGGCNHGFVIEGTEA